MKLFSFKALTEEGKLLEGTKAASSKEEVYRSLEEQGYLPLVVEERKRFFKLPVFRKKISKKDIIFFTQILSILVSSGVPVDKALFICADISRGRPIATVIEDLINEIRQGASLSEAFSKYPSIFSKLYINTVRAGEAIGLLGEVLDRIYKHMQKTEEFKNSIVNALIYPTFLVGISVISIVVLIAFVIPRFYSVFLSSGIKPPFPIPQLTVLGDFVVNYGSFILLVLLLAFFLGRWWYLNKGKKSVQKRLLSIPFIGDFLIKLETVRFASNMGTLLNNGVPILQAILIVKEMFGLEVYREEMDRVYKEVREGKKLTYVLGNRKDLWHPLLVDMGEVGEETGQLGYTFIKASEILETDMNIALTRIITIIEPATILTMGLIVGGIVVSMINAIFSINEMVR